MARSNRLLLAGGIVTLLGALLVLVVTMGQGSPSADPTAAERGGDDPSVQTSQADEPATPAVQVDEDGQPIFDIPEGREALALTVDFERSVAGLPAVGDRVNVYGVFATHEADLVDGLPAVRRVLADVSVLAVTGAAHDSNGGAPTFVLALAPDDVEAAIWTHTAESIYLSLVDDDTGFSPETSGVDAGSLER